MNISNILNRINANSNNLEPSLLTLNNLINSFLNEVPYENLDFFTKNSISFNIFDIYEKIVNDYRGGICYETNTLFAYLLKSLKFDVYMIFANVKDLTYIGSSYPHLALIVTIDNKKYLVDVGFGQNVKEAMPIDNFAYVAKHENILYKCEYSNGLYTLLNKKNSNWIISYNFTLAKKNLNDYKDIFSNEINNKKKQLPALLITKVYKNGRATLYNDSLSLVLENEKRKWQVDDSNKLEVLRDYFNINLKGKK